MLKGVPLRIPGAGLRCADEIMERGVVLPVSHALDDEDINFVIARVEDFLARFQIDPLNYPPTARFPVA